MSECTEWQPAVLWRTEGDRLRCTLCPHDCLLSSGAVGRCHVRRAGDAGMETATFATSVLHRHRIERKPFYHVRPGLPVITLGAPGCSMACRYCQNHALSQYGRTDATWSARPVTATARVALVQTAASDGAGIALSYSEPSLATELTLALAEQAGVLGVPLLWKSNGFFTREVAVLASEVLTAINVDLKTTDDAAHRWLTGVPVAAVLRSIDTLRDRGVWLELSTPVIPGFNDDEGTLHAMARAVAAVGSDVPWHLLRFHPDHRMPTTPPTPPATLQRAVDIAHDAGVRHVYVERALGANARATRCPSCADVVIQRHEIWGAGQGQTDGRCRCGTQIPGVWSSLPPTPRSAPEVDPTLPSSSTCPT
jgi:pyruvate formate lyase activating enzyme